MSLFLINLFTQHQSLTSKKVHRSPKEISFNLCFNPPVTPKCIMNKVKRKLGLKCSVTRNFCDQGGHWLRPWISIGLKQCCGAGGAEIIWDIPYRPYFLIVMVPVLLLYSTVFSGNIWQELELVPEPKLWKTVDPESKIEKISAPQHWFKTLFCREGTKILFVSL